MAPQQSTVDPTDAANVKMVRALHDPIVAYEPEYIPGDDNAFVQTVTPARLAQVQEYDAAERITEATMPEVSIFCMTATLADESWARGTASRMYRYAFRESLERWLPEHADSPALESVRLDVELEDHERKQFDKLRKSIKRARDQQFLEDVYPDLETDTPKSFWKADGPLVGDLADDLVD